MYILLYSFSNHLHNQISLETANERKEEGNQFFRAGKWNDALVAYQAALNCVPKRSQAKGKEKSTTDVEGEHVSEPAKEEVVTDISSPAVTDTEKNNSKLRAILNSNIGACYVKLVCTPCVVPFYTPVPLTLSVCR